MTILQRSPLLLCAVLGTALALGSRDAHAQLVVGNDQSGTASLYDININTGVATPI